MKAVLLGCLALALASRAMAHRLDECLQATRIAVATNRIDLAIALTPGVAVADQWLALVDTDRDGQVSEAERAAYGRKMLEDLQLTLDETALTLRPVEVSFPSMIELRSGVGVIHIKATATVAPLASGKHTLTLTNAHLPTISVYLVNALTPQDAAIQVTSQQRDGLQRTYRLEFDVGRTRLSRP
jgi:hypothetical protein